MPETAWPHARLASPPAVTRTVRPPGRFRSASSQGLGPERYGASERSPGPAPIPATEGIRTRLAQIGKARRVARRRLLEALLRGATGAPRAEIEAAGVPAGALLR